MRQPSIFLIDPAVAVERFTKQRGRHPRSRAGWTPPDNVPLRSHGAADTARRHRGVRDATPAARRAARDRERPDAEWLSPRERPPNAADPKRLATAPESRDCFALAGMRERGHFRSLDSLASRPR